MKRATMQRTKTAKTDAGKKLGACQRCATAPARHTCSLTGEVDYLCTDCYSETFPCTHCGREGTSRDPLSPDVCEDEIACAEANFADEAEAAGES